jgi:hypothetical protein
VTAEVLNRLPVLCADLVQTNGTSESIKGKRKEKKSVNIFISTLCEEALSISYCAVPGDWMSELNWKSLRTQW